MPKNPHLQDLWDNPTSATAKDEVRRMMESEGWKYLTEAIDARLRWEQRQMMLARPQGDESYDRAIGKWAGLESIEALAQQIVKHGDEAEAKLRAA